MAHWRHVWFDTTDSAAAEVDDRWEINGAKVEPEHLTSLAAKLAAALEVTS